MSVISLLSNNYSIFHKGVIFLLRLAWKSRIKLPYLIMIGFMVLDIRLTIEIQIDAEIQTPDGYEDNNSSDSEDLDVQRMGN